MPARRWLSGFCQEVGRKTRLCEAGHRVSGGGGSLFGEPFQCRRAVGHGGWGVEEASREDDDAEGCAGDEPPRFALASLRVARAGHGHGDVRVRSHVGQLAFRAHDPVNDAP